MASVLVTSKRQLKQFVELPYQHYAGHPHWIPPLRRDEYKRLDPRRNPFFQHADYALWLSEAEGRVVGRVGAFDDRLYNQKFGQHTVFFGFFEADSAETARGLLGAVESWAVARGASTIQGPANPSLNESAGLLIDAFDDDPFILMPYNPPEYVGFVEAAGYRKVKDLIAWSFDARPGLGERIRRVADRLRRRHAVTIRPVDLKHFDRDLVHLMTLYRAAWEDNWGFVAPTDDEIQHLAIDLKPIVDTELVLLAEMSNRPVGCVVAIPDLNQVLKRMNGRLLPFGLWHFLRRRSIINRARTLLIGVVPDARKLGLYPMLIAELFDRGVKRGYIGGELSWTLEDNVDVNAGIEAAGGQRHKTYRMYEKIIGR